MPDVPAPPSAARREELAALNRRRLALFGSIFAVGWLIAFFVDPRNFPVPAILPTLLLMPLWFTWLVRKWPRRWFRRAMVTMIGAIPGLAILITALCVGTGQTTHMAMAVGIVLFLWAITALPTLLIAYYFRADDPDLREAAATPPHSADEPNFNP